MCVARKQFKLIYSFFWVKGIVPVLLTTFNDRQSYIPRPLAKRLREKEKLVEEEVERENQAKKAKLN